MIATETGQETAVVWLVGYSMFVTLGGWISLLAYRIRSRVPRPETVLWEYFALVGVAGLLAGLVGLARMVFDAAAVALSGVASAILLGFALLCALSMREAYFNTVLSNTERERFVQYRLRRALEIGFVLSVLVVGIGAVVHGSTPSPGSVGSIAAIGAVSAVSIIGYGLYFQRERTRLPATRGTVVDTLLRQLVPVLVFAGGALSIPVLLAVSVDGPVAGTVAAVLVVMASTSLVPVTIKFRQHLSVQR